MPDAPTGITGPFDAGAPPAVGGARLDRSTRSDGRDTNADLMGDWDDVVRGSAPPPTRTAASKSVSRPATPGASTPNVPTDTKLSRRQHKAARKATTPATGSPTATSAVTGPPRPGTPGKKPISRRAQRRLRKRLRPPFWRGRVIPKTVLGISFTMLVAGLAMASSGAGLFMNYRYRQDQSDALVRNFDARTRQATRAVQAEGTNARAQVQQELEPLRKLAATAETLSVVLTKAQPSTFSVTTFDVNGAPVVGTAFVVASDDQKSFLLTSYAVVRAAATRPGPAVTVRKGAQEMDAKLWTWQEDRDMALLIVNTGNLPRLDWAAPDAARLGDQVFAMSGLGSANASITQGFIADVSSTGLQHSAPLGTAFQGGPLLTAQGRVVAMASRSYAPLGFVSDGVFFAPPVQAACEKVLKCPNGQVTSAGDQR